MKMKNTPYVKEYKKGILQNPIGEEEGYIHQGENRSSRRKSLGRLFSNKKGLQLVITRYGNKFYKVKKHLTFLKGKTILTYS